MSREVASPRPGRTLRRRGASGGAVPADPHDDHAGHDLRGGVVLRVEAADDEAPDEGEDRVLRVRHRLGAGAGRAVPGALLPRRADVHRPRRRDHLPLPLHHHLPRARRLRARADGDVPAGADRAVRLPALGRRARLGTGAPGHRAACSARSCGPRPCRRASRRPTDVERAKKRPRRWRGSTQSRTTSRPVGSRTS